MSSPHVTKRLTCRVCRSSTVAPFLNLGEFPPANNFLRKEELTLKEDRFPLELSFCSDCGLVQVLDIVNPALLFGDYPYFTSASKPLSDHFARMAESIHERYLNGTKQLVVEMGSNDGTLLAALFQKGARVLGVEPAETVGQSARLRGVETTQAFFSEALAKKIKDSKGEAQVIVASNVFAHIDDLDDVVRGVKYLMADKGVFISEVHYLDDLIHHGGYDQVYHEHLSYFSLKPLKYLFERFGLDIIDVNFFNIHGKLLRVTAAHQGAFKPDSKVAALIQEEDKEGLHSEDTFHIFAQGVMQHRKELIRLIKELRQDGKTIVGYGAPAKGNTLLNYCNLGSDFIDYLIDTTPAKQGTFAPGTRLAVHPPEKTEKDPPDYFLLLAWNYADYIFEKEKEFHSQGGRFIVPFPLPKIV